MRALICVSVYLACGLDAAALPVDPLREGLHLPVTATALTDSVETMAPIAFIRFCHVHADQCAVTDRDRRIALADPDWRTLNAVNRAVNRSIHVDSAKGAFDWSVNTTYGNCNDYAVQKRKLLIDRGYPASALSLAAVVTPSGIGHLVLTVRTDRGDFVLDNLRSEIVPWSAAGYRWLMRQSANDLTRWVAVDATLPRARLLATRARLEKAVRMPKERQLDVQAKAPSAAFSRTPWLLGTMPLEFGPLFTRSSTYLLPAARASESEVPAVTAWRPTIGAVSDYFFRFSAYLLRNGAAENFGRHCRAVPESGIIGLVCSQ